MLHTIKNNNLRISVSEHGAELRSLTEISDGTEYLWNGDISWWKYTSPILFPIVGKLVDGKYYVEGREYKLPAHGFGRISEFTLIEKKSDKISFALSWTKDTLNIYPYKFSLQISYTLKDNAVLVSWLIKNLDDKEIFFSIGAHPALLCPIIKGESIKDYYLEFNKTESAKIFSLTPECLLLHKKFLKFTGKICDLSYDLFKNGVLVCNNLKSDMITIQSKKNAKSLSIRAKDFTCWGFWSPEKGGAPFICIEPWFGHADFADHNGKFNEKDGNIKLKPGLNFTAEYSFIVNQ